MTYLILSLILGVSAAIVVWVLFFVIDNKLNPNILRRLDRIKRKTNPSEVDTGGLDLSRQNLEYKFQFFGELFHSFGIMKQIKELISLADVNLHIDTFIFLSGLCSLPFMVFLFTPFKLMSLFGIAAFFIPMMYLKFLVSKRFNDFSRQFPDALNLMASSLRAGHPLFAAINIVTDEMPKPISDVFETAQKDISLGVNAKEAFYSMLKIMPNSLDLNFFITAVLIQKEVGGNLAELLDSLSDTIRERFKLIGQLRAQTAQTRFSGLVIGVVPIMVILVIFFMNPEYIRPLFETQDGQLAFAIAIGLVIAGFVSIKKISEIEI